MRVSHWMTIAALLVTGLAWAADQPAPVQNAVARVAKLLAIPADQVQVVSVEGVDWPDTSLGAPRPGRMYAQVITPGFRVLLSAQGKRFEYHTDMRQNAVLASIDGRKAGDTGASSPRPKPASGDALQACRADLAARLHVEEAAITVAETKAATFPDAALGLPRPGEVVAQVETPGQIVLLVVKGLTHLYTTSGQSFRYGGPLSARQCSALLIEPAGDEANMNGNLVQVTLAGTNPTPVMPLVDNFRPQLDGSIMGMRRTSRSGYDLLYLAPGATKEIRIASGLYFADATVSVDGKRWAAIMRPGLGSGWKVQWGALPTGEKGIDIGSLLGEKNIVDVPEGTDPKRIYWHDTNPVIMSVGGVQPVFYELQLDAEKPTWRPAGAFFLPPTEETMLNKSESLVVETETKNGKPTTHVATRWFTGDENHAVDIPDFAVKEFSLAPGRFVFLYGTRGEQGLALTVSLMTGEVLTTVERTNSPVRLWLAPPQGWIWSHLKAAE